MGVYLEGLDPVEFDWKSYATKRLPASYPSLSPELKREARIHACRTDPLLWAILYHSKLLMAGGEGITFADMHFDMCRIARHFLKPLDAIDPLRWAFIAPRRSGKTSWLFKILLTWVAAYGHRKFFHVVCGTGGAANIWMMNFKMIISQNQFIQSDFPALCRPLKRDDTGRAFADGQRIYMAESGFILGTQSADGNSLGLNVDDERPDMILFDDIEPPGGSYSLAEMSKRLTNIQEGAIPMGQEGCSVLFVGTVLMPGSIMDQLREHSEKPEPNSWISDERIRVRWYKPFVNLATKEQSIQGGPGYRSFWPGRHKTEMMQRDQNTRVFAIKYANLPLPENGAYWREGDIKYATNPRYGTIPYSEGIITAIVLDPALTTKKKSDFSAICVIRFAPGMSRFEVLYGRSFKLNPGVEVAQKITEIKAYFPEATLLVVEENAGGGYNREAFADLPGLTYFPIRHNSDDGNKAKRAAPVLRLYQLGRVVHIDDSLIELERELYSFPKGLHDDLPDALCFGIQTLLDEYGSETLDDLEYSYI